MTRHEATFEITSKTDAHAARLFAERAYDTLREELRELGGNEADAKEVLQQFEAIREATRRTSHGRLTVVYESDEESFGE